MAEWIPDEAVVVRGGRNPPETCDAQPEFIAEGMAVAELTAAIPHGQIGVTTVGRFVRLAETWCEPLAAVPIMPLELA